MYRKFIALRPFVRFAMFALLGTVASHALAAGSLIISEFRLRGPSGANDEFIEIYNDSGADHTVTAISGTGYAVAASDGVVRCTIPNGTVIPSRGHFLCTNSVAYSLGGYATGDATYATDIADNAGIALFNNNTGGGSFSLANRFDAVGSTSEADTLYKEGTGYPALTPFSIDYSFSRDECGKGGAVNLLGPCTISTPKDTDDNAVDFIFNDTNGTSAGAGQRLGAPGPQNLASHIAVGGVTSAALDATVSDYTGPNMIRDFTSVPASNSTFGTISLRRRITNGTGGNVTGLRFRIIDIDTFPAASGFADLRARTSGAVVVAGINDPATCAATGAPATPPCTVTAQGTTLEQPPSQPNGSGFNGSLSAGTITLGTPLANGASMDLQFLFGIQQTGNFRVSMLMEGLPQGGSTVIYLECNTEGCTAGPTVTSIVRVGADPTNAASVQYTVTFSASVTGVDVADFALTSTGAVAGASVTGVSGSGSVYTVTVNTGTGDGTLRLDVVDNDSIVNGTLIPLGGVGAGNGDFNTGEVYTIDKTAPTVTINQAAAQTDPTGTSPINFTVTFSEVVTGFLAADVGLSGTALPTAATVSGGPTTFNVAVSGMSANGSVIATIGAAAATDTPGNNSAASTSTDNTVTFTGIASTSFSGPTATGTGSVTASFTGGGAGCTYSGSQLIGAPPGAPPVPPTAPPGVTFPHGLFTFTTTGCTPGGALTFTIVYPAPLPAGAQYWKYGPTSGQPADHWYVVPAVFAGNTVTLTITDGGLGDDDLAANGSIADQGGPGVPGTPTTIPTVSEWMLMLIAALLLATGGVYVRRRRPRD